MTDSITDSRTLDEVAADDYGMAKDAVKNAKRYKFQSNIKGSKQATLFIGHCVAKSLGDMGFIVSPDMNPKMIDRMFKTHKIRIETRDKYSGEDIWRNGTYIFKNDELRVFVSKMLKRTPGTFDRDRSEYISVVTNARV